jgi:transaldolase / glucose-6-phosphate isomerase
VEVCKNPGLRLGAELGELARVGRDKVIFVTSPTLAAFPAWAEQLIAESTGKIGKGIVPVAGEVEPLESYDARDRVLVYLTVRGEEDEGIDSGLARLEAAGTPALVSELGDRHDLGAEFFRWEVAIASAGAILGIDPYDQPDVEQAKELAREAMAAPPGARSASPTVQRAASGDDGAVRTALTSWRAKAKPDDYVAIQAYLAPSGPMDEALRALRAALRSQLKLSTTLGYGPRFLHSTGQLHKGGPNSGLFLQLVDAPSEDLEVPPGKVTFARILRAQADGDALALLQKGRRVLSIDLGGDAIDAMAGLSRLVQG